MPRKKFDREAPQNVLIYTRVSTDRQNPESPERQENLIRRGIDQCGLPWTVVGTYCDRGISGQLQSKRPGLQQMLQDLRTGKVRATIVTVDTRDRFSRADGDDLYRKFQKLGVFVLTADSNFVDPTSQSGRADKFVHTMRSSEENKTKARMVLSGKCAAAAKGHWPGGPAPFGYSLHPVMCEVARTFEFDHNTLVPDLLTGWILQLILELADTKGWGGSIIAKHLNAHPDIPDELKPFHTSTVNSIIDNEICTGVLVFNKVCTGIEDDARWQERNPESEWVRYENFCEPLVDRERWVRVHTLRVARGERARLARAARREATGSISSGIPLKYPLSGLVRCAHCGRSMYPTSSGEYRAVEGDTRRYVYYACPASCSGVCPNNKKIPEEWLRKTVIDLMRRRLFGAE